MSGMMFRRAIRRTLWPSQQHGYVSLAVSGPSNARFVPSNASSPDSSGGASGSVRCSERGSCARSHQVAGRELITAASTSRDQRSGEGLDLLGHASVVSFADVINGKAFRDQADVGNRLVSLVPLTRFGQDESS